MPSEWSLPFRLSKYNVCISYLPVRATCLAHYILDLIILVIFGEEHKRTKSNYACAQ
jgi:hypothetical protein